MSSYKWTKSSYAVLCNFLNNCQQVWKITLIWWIRDLLWLLFKSWIQKTGKGWRRLTGSWKNYGHPERTTVVRGATRWEPVGHGGILVILSYVGESCIYKRIKVWEISFGDYESDREIGCLSIFSGNSCWKFLCDNRTSGWKDEGIRRSLSLI